MTHWRLSEGNLDIIDDHKEHYKNMQSTIDFYKHKISEMKGDFGEELFIKEARKHMMTTDAKGKECKA